MCCSVEAYLEHRKWTVRPAGTTINWYVLVPRGNAKVETVHITPVKLCWKLMFLQKLSWLVVVIVLFLDVLMTRHALLPVSSSSEGGNT